MRFMAPTVVVAALAFAGCGEVKKEIDKPGPAPPYDPKGAALDPKFVQPDNAATEAAKSAEEARAREGAEIIEETDGALKASK
jgi:hypothetical protein